MLYKVVVLLLALIPVIFLGPRLFTGLYARSLTYPVNEAPSRPVAIVFGAGLTRDGSPTPVLRDRVETAVRLYQDGKVQQLLMSGGYTWRGYSEPDAMRRYAVSLGVPEQNIQLDYAGQRTYDTCYRAQHIFHVTQAILVTQGFHLPRAVYLCRALGLPAVGVASDIRQYRPFTILYWNLRELPATLGALWDVHIARPAPATSTAQPDSPPEAQ